MTEKRKKSWLREWMEAFVWALLVVLLLRLFALEAFTIPTNSMDRTLQPGDFILVSKINYGARMPFTPLTFPFAHQTIPFTDHKGYSEKPSLPYMRLGEGTVDRNDVIVFNNPSEKEFPVDHRTHFVKRCVGLPGDTLEIKHGVVLINGQAQPLPKEAMLKYFVKTDPAGFDVSILDTWGITTWDRISTDGDYLIPLPERYVDSLQLVQGVISIERLSDQKDSHNFLFPYSADYPWNLDYFGPVIIPAAGETVILNRKNFPLYKDLLLSEGNTAEVHGDSIILDNTVTANYTFRYNHFFVMGDNRYYSADSRYWGFVPETHLVGKAWLVLFSVRKEGPEQGSIRWDRLFKSIE